MGVQFFTDGPGIMAGADPAWQLKQQQVNAIDTFKSGLPTDANGNVDYTAAAKMLLQKGAFEPAKDLLTIGVQQRALQAGLNAADNLANGGVGAPAAPGPQTAPPSSYTKPLPGFDNAVNRTLGFEGGLNKSDTNGTPTNYGINQAAHPGVDVSKLTPDQAKGIYKTQYWDAIGADNLPPALARVAFDTAVIAGPDRAKQMLAASGGDPMKFMDLREQYLNGLVQQDPSKYGQYQKAWTARNNGLRYDVLALNAAGAGPNPSAPSGGGAPAQADTNAPVQVAQNGSSDAPQSTHPYAAAQPVGAGAPAAGGPAAPSAPTNAPAVPAAVAAPTLGDGTTSSIIDPTMGGLLKGQWVGNPGGYVSALRSQAVRLATLGNTAAANAYDKQADAVERGIERNNIVTNTMKDYQIARQQGYQGSMMQYAADLEAQKEVAKIKAQGDPDALKAAGQKAQAEAAGSEQGKVPYELVPTQPTPGGPTVLVPKSQILAANTPTVSQQPAAFAKRQDDLAKQDGDMMQAYQRRQIAKERIDAMTNLLQTFQSGAGADQKAAAIAAARSIGINIPSSATASPEAVEQFSKNTQANIFDQAKSLGSKVLVSELAGLQKSNANPNMQPASNVAILAQQRGLLDWQDAHDKAYFDWRQANPYAYDPSQFEEQWAAKNPPSAYVAAARKNITALGLPLPPKNQLVDGQAYMVKGQKMRWSQSANGFVPDQPSQ